MHYDDPAQERMVQLVQALIELDFITRCEQGSFKRRTIWGTNLP